MSHYIIFIFHIIIIHELPHISTYHPCLFPDSSTTNPILLIHIHDMTVIKYYKMLYYKMLQIVINKITYLIPYSYYPREDCSKFQSIYHWPCFKSMVLGGFGGYHNLAKHPCFTHESSAGSPSDHLHLATVILISHLIFNYYELP
jgi:hypothetical protein